MPVEPIQFRGVECTVCDRKFDDMNVFKGHEADGEPCEGGTPA